MSSVDPERKRNFSRWARSERRDLGGQLDYAATTFVPILEKAGFQWREKCFDGGAAPTNAMNFERDTFDAQVDYVMIVFDKFRRPRFQIIFGSKSMEAPHRWIRAGSLVWKKGREAMKYKWWGPRWWQFSKIGTLEKEIDRAAQLVPQIINFLSGRSAEAHVWQDEI